MKVGDWIKCEKWNGSHEVFRLAGFASGNKLTPDGWLVGEDGSARNPKDCELYKGATSVLEGISNA